MKVRDSDNYLFMGVVALFLLINFNPDVGQIYSVMVLLAWLGYFVARQLNVSVFPLSSEKRSIVQSIAIGVAAYAAFIFITSRVFSVFGYTEYLTPKSIITLVAKTFSQTPILAESKLISGVTWGGLIPWIETVFFFTILLGWTLYYIKVNPSLPVYSRKVLLLLFFLAAVFMAFHFTAKGITNNAALMATFIFGLISLVLVWVYKQAREAIVFHVISNGLAILYILDVQLLSVANTSVIDYLPVAGLILIGYYLFKRLKSANLHHEFRRLRRIFSTTSPLEA